MIINIEKKYAFIIFGLLVSAMGIFLIYALIPGETPNPGHNIQSVGPPSECADGNVLRFSGGSWDCVALPGIDAIPSGLCMFKFSGSCPSGWSRNSALDSRTIRGAATPGGTGGSESHSHTGPSHSHKWYDFTGTYSHSKTYNSVGTAVDLSDAGLMAPSWRNLNSHVVAETSSGDTDYPLNDAWTSNAGTGATSSTSSWPPYINAIICCKN